MRTFLKHIKHRLATVGAILIMAQLFSIYAETVAATYEYSLRNFADEWKNMPISDADRKFLYEALITAQESYTEKGHKDEYKKLLRIADSIPNKIISSILYARIATDFADASDPNCFSILEKGLNAAKKENNSYGIIYLLHARAYLKWVLQESPGKRIEYLNELKQESTKRKIEFGVALAIKEKAFLYYWDNQLDSAKHYSEISLKEYFPYYNSNTIIGLYNLLGLIENKNKNYTNAIIHFNKTIQYAYNVNDTAWVGIASGNKGMSFYNMSMYDSAFVNFKTDIKYSLLGKEFGSASLAMTALADMFLTVYQKPDSAEYYFNLAISTAQQGRTEGVIATLQKIHESYAKNSFFEKAYRFHLQYIDIRDSLKPLLAEKQLEDFQKQFELQKRDNEIEILEKENLLQTKKTQQIRIIVATLSIIVALLVILLVVFYDMKERNRRVSIQINEQNEAIKKQAQDLKTLNEVKDKIFSILSHDMRSPIASVKNTFDLLDAKMINEEEFATLKEKISDQLSTLNIVLDNLLQWSKSQIYGNEIHIETNVNLHDLTQRSLSLFEAQIKNKNLFVNAEIEKSLTVLADYNKLDIVVRNLISNAVKFTLPGGSISIYSEQHEKNITLCIKDSGNGIREEDQKDIFKIKGSTRQYGTAGESGTGLGLWLCKNYIEQNKGKIYFTSESGKGSTFCISLPIATV